jgi:alpha-L-arabinofuranosidase
MKSVRRTITQINTALLLGVFLLPSGTHAQTRPVSVAVDASKTGAPISKYIYGQFLEHGGNIVNVGVWAEMAADRKFYNRVTSKFPVEPPGPTRQHRGPLRCWIPVGGDQPAVSPRSDTHPLDVSAALSEDRKTLTIAVLNPSDAEQSMNLAANGARLAPRGTFWQMAPSRVDALVALGKAPERVVEEHQFGSISKMIEVPPFNINIYSYPAQ